MQKQKLKEKEKEVEKEELKGVGITPQRASGKFTLGLSILKIPLKIYTLQRGNSSYFNEIHSECKGQIGRKKVCKVCNKEVPKEDVLKGYKLGNDYVTFTEGELKTLNAVSETFELLGFAQLHIDSMFVDKTYLLKPDKLSKYYHLLRESLSATAKSLVGKFTFRNKQHIAIVRPYQQFLLLDLLFFAEEIADLSKIEIESAEITEKELGLGIQLIEKVGNNFKYGTIRNDYKERLEQLIERKLNGEEIAVTTEKPIAEANLEGELEKALEVA